MWKAAILGAGALWICSCQVSEGPEQTVPIHTAGTGGSGGSGLVRPDASADSNVPDAAVSEAMSPLPAGPTWSEHWLEHNQTVKLIGQDDNHALYFDDGVEMAAATWAPEFISRLWSYTKTTYGTFGDPRLFVILHGGRYSGGHTASIFDPTHDHRNVVDYGLAAADWSTPEFARSLAVVIGWLLDQVPGGVDTSPSAALTGFTVAPIYAYDAMKALGMTKAADDLFAAYNIATNDSPRVGTYWFRDWHYPLWQEGGAAVFARYLKLLNQHYPKVLRVDGRGQMYAMKMNFGEYIHFMSGAARRDLQVLATQAFGWPAERDAMFKRAQTDFPAIKY